jgi:citrate synthase
MQETLNKGLRNVVLDRTQSSYIDGEKGILLYRGYSIHDLAEHSSFEEVCYLLIHGVLPTSEEFEAFRRRLSAQRAVAPEVIETIRLNQSAHPMDVMRTAVSSLATFDPETADMSRAANVRKSERVTAQIATVVAAHERIRRGLDAVEPRPDLSHAANFLYMLRGEEPSPEAVAAMDLDFLLHAEHGANASAFAGRVTASTESDMHSAVVAAIATLKGPLHGGAAEAVMRMVLDIGELDRVHDYVTARQRDRNNRVMGFGHRVYRAEDPRARHMREKSRQLSERMGQSKWYEILLAVEKEMERYQRHGIFVNVDFYAGSVYYLLGIPEDLFIPIFAIGRAPGWCVEILEQYDNNMLIRPLLKYVGPMDAEYVPLEARRR